LYPVESLYWNVKYLCMHTPTPTPYMDARARAHTHLQTQISRFKPNVLISNDV
jgi:hypothetical protein